MIENIKCPNCSTEHLIDYIINKNDKRLFKGTCKACNIEIKFKINNTEGNGLLEKDSISFLINGIQYTIGNEYPFDMTLNDYLRNVLNMTGTKVMCREGGCGSCVVNAEVFDYVTNQPKNISINSCLFPLYSCENLKLTTVEGIGNKAIGFNDIQNRIVDYNASQCGWCTPGMVMNMYSLLSENPKPTKSLIENSFDGNICRCTGYRSILDAMKSFSKDGKPIDIEELDKLKCLNGKNKKCNGINKKLHLIQDSSEWYSPNNMDDLYSLLYQYQNSSYRIVSGNTGVGVFKNDGPYKVYIDVKNIAELYIIERSSYELTLGSEISLKKLIDIFNDYSTTIGFEYLSVISEHISKIANVAVRNTGTWSGNLFMKCNHQEFESDIFICFETIEATVTLVGPDKFTPAVQVTPYQLLTTPLQGRLLYSVTLQPFDKAKTLIKTYKIMPRSQNAHAYVNAGFRFEIDPDNLTVQTLPSIVIGGINRNFVHATKTEKYLLGKTLSDQQIITNAFKILDSELIPDNDPALADPKYRKSLAISLFFKFILYVNYENIDPNFQSAIESVIDTRSISSGKQDYSVNPNTFPVTKPMSKTNSILQASGEAEYVLDIPSLGNELHAAFIISTIGNCYIDQIDTSDALTVPGVVKLIFAQDLKENNFKNSVVANNSEILFSEGFVDYAGQAIGLVVADTFEIAMKAAKLVKITYKDRKKPILSINDAIAAQSIERVDEVKYGDADSALNTAPNVIVGECLIDTQFHFYMESQVALCQQNEEGVDIYASTQWVDFLQNAVVNALGLRNSSSVNVKVKQIGGGYGGKITRANIPAVAGAIATKLLNKPVRVTIDLNTTMEMIGKRIPWCFKYKIGFDNSGKLLAITGDMYINSGFVYDRFDLIYGKQFFDNVYKCENWKISLITAKTNLPSNTACRSPASFSSIAITEYIMDHVSKYLNADPLQIRQLNMYKNGDVSPFGNKLPYFNVDQIIDQLKSSCDYDNRLANVNDFNKDNRWKKKGLALTPLKWNVGWKGTHYSVTISIYSYDGSIGVLHGGVEIGQGIHTKVAQVIAYELNVPMDIINVKHASNTTCPNSQNTGGSVTTEMVSMVAIQCCKILNDNLDPIRQIMPEGYTWLQLVQKAFMSGVDLTARKYNYVTDSSYSIAYNIYGAACSEIILDILTGEYQLLRTDIMYDCGTSINPEIDIGQAEGAFMMGVGNILFEKMRYDPDTGKCLTNGTWEYKPPTTKDIPIDLRITFLKNNPNPLGVLGSKCVGEPPLCLSPSVGSAIRRAIDEARKEINNNDYFGINAPLTVEDAQQLCLIDFNQFKLKK